MTTLEEAKRIFEEEYERARGLKYVIDPLAYALYHTWKRVDKKGAKREQRKSN